MAKWTCLVVLTGIASSLSAAEIKDLVSSDAAPTKVVGDCKFTEGPAFSPKGFLLFSDIPNSRIVRVDADGKSSDFLKPSGNANGLVFDAAGHLYACQGGARRVVKIANQDGKIETLCDSYDGKPINSPNDLALDGHGGLYFTDPRYSGDSKVEQPCMGVYYIDATGKTTRVIDSLKRPNGILVSIDMKTLYVAEPDKRELWKYEITAPGKLSSGKMIFTGDEKEDGGGPDGMCLDMQGNIYTTYNGIVVLNSDGKLIGRIAVPEHPANCTFGGVDGKTLYITARTSLYSVAMKVAGAPLAANGPRPAPQVTRRESFRGPARLTQDKKSDSKDKEEAKEVAIGDLKLKIPTTWKQEDPSNNMRLAQFKPPAAEGDKPTTELVISSFPGGGGGVDLNFKRWIDQFTSEARKVKMTSGECEQGKYYVSDITGTYLQSSGGPFAGGKKTPMAGYRSLSIVLAVPEKGVYFLRLTGPEKTVEAAAASFRKSFGGDASKEAEYEMK